MIYYAPVSKPCSGGEIGRHVCLRCIWRDPCGFESRPEHHLPKAKVFGFCFPAQTIPKTEVPRVNIFRNNVFWIWKLDRLIRQSIDIQETSQPHPVPSFKPSEPSYGISSRDCPITHNMHKGTPSRPAPQSASRARTRPPPAAVRRSHARPRSSP